MGPSPLAVAVDEPDYGASTGRTLARRRWTFPANAALVHARFELQGNDAVPRWRRIMQWFRRYGCERSRPSWRTGASFVRAALHRGRHFGRLRLAAGTVLKLDEQYHPNVHPLAAPGSAARATRTRSRRRRRPSSARPGDRRGAACRRRIAEQRVLWSPDHPPMAMRASEDIGSPCSDRRAELAVQQKAARRRPCPWPAGLVYLR